MVTSDHNNPELRKAMALVAENPSRDHIEEDFQVSGQRKDIADMIGDSVARSHLLGCAVNGREAFVCGVDGSGFVRYQVWVLGTDGITRLPYWLSAELHEILSEAESRYRWPCRFYQAIPETYGAGLRFSRHMGFREAGRMSRGGRADLVIVERAIPK